MQEILISKLWDHIIQNNPELLFTLEEEGSISQYLEDKISSVETLLPSFYAQGKLAYLIEDISMEALTKELRPSKFNYLQSLLEDEFEGDYHRLNESGILIYEVVNLIAICTPIFESFGFTEENEDDRQLRYALIGTVQEYLQNTLRQSPPSA